MKKLLSLAAVVIGLNAYQIDIQSGWQLKGALENINVTDVFNKQEIISVWTYDDEDNKWKAYLPNKDVDLEKYGIKPLSTIHRGEGFWVNANNSLLIETGNITNANDSNISYTGTITENNLVDKPTTFSLSDIANKTFKVFVEGDFIEVTFNSNGVANITIDDKTYEAKLENGIIKVYENDSLINEYKKVKADENGIIVFGKDLENNEYFIIPWLTTINPVDMSTLNYPFTVYETDYDYVEKITFENNKIVFESGWELNSTIENGKIVAIDEYVSGDGNYGERDVYQIQYIGEIDRYKIPKIDGYWEYWKIDNNLVGLTFNDIIDTNQSIFSYNLYSNGTVSYENNSDVNITYQLINSTEINLTECSDDGYCDTYKIILDPSTGKLTKSGTLSYVAIHSENPIIIGNNNSIMVSDRILSKHNSIKDRILRYKKLRKKPF